MTLKLRILRSLTRLFIILLSLTRSLFSKKMLISNRCISGMMSNLDGLYCATLCSKFEVMLVCWTVCFHGKKSPLFRLMRAAAPVIVSPFHISRIALVKTMLLALPTDVHFPRRVLNSVRIQEFKNHILFCTFQQVL